MNVTVGIVLYNPDISKLEKCINEFNYTKIILVDNNSKNIEDIENVIKNFKNIKIIKNSENLGIAKALNQLFDEAIKSSHLLLTLDQDSFLKREYLEKMTKNIDNNIAIVCPRIIDINRKKQKPFNGEKEFIERCITSGSLMNLEVCDKIGKFDEKMFIDYVDFDYCKKVILNKYKILRINDALIKHEVGKRTSRRFFFIKVYPTNHNANRVYYYSRNIKYYLRKYKKDLIIKEKYIEYRYLLWKFIGILFYEKEKIQKLRMYFKGINDGKRM